LTDLFEADVVDEGLGWLLAVRATEHDRDTSVCCVTGKP
jgi:hypothetical protein